MLVMFKLSNAVDANSRVAIEIDDISAIEQLDINRVESNVYLRNGVLFAIEASIEDIARKDVGARAAAGKIGRNSTL